MDLVKRAVSARSWLLPGPDSDGAAAEALVHEGDRPAIYSAQFALSHACWLIAYPLTGWIGSAAGLTAAFAVLAAIAFVCSLAAAFLWPAHDPIKLEHRHEVRVHEHSHVHDEHHQHEHEGWEGPEPHRHPHRHKPTRHKHAFVIDYHHERWPKVS